MISGFSLSYIIDMCYFLSFSLISSLKVSFFVYNRLGKFEWEWKKVCEKKAFSSLLVNWLFYNTYVIRSIFW